jgi:hypothetical protein
VPLKGLACLHVLENFGPLDGSLKLRQNQRQGGHLPNSKMLERSPREMPVLELSESCQE